MAPPIAHRKQHFYNEMQARFCCPGKKTFTDIIELGRCLGLWVILVRILNQPLFAPFAALNSDIQPAFDTNYAAIVEFQNAGLSCPGAVWDTVHHAHPGLCPTLQRANITSSAAIEAEYQLQVQHFKLHAVLKRLAKLASEYHN